MDTVFVKKKIGTLTLGEKLRKIRLEKRMTQQEVSRMTRIQVKHIQNLEEGKYDLLPADVYTRGFIRSYADFFGLEEVVLLKAYEKEKEIKKNVQNNSQSEKGDLTKKPIKISAFVLTPEKIIAFFFFTLIAGGGVYLYRQIGLFTNEPRLAVLGPKNNSETSENFTEVFGVTDRDARVFINNQPVLVGDDGKFKESVTLQAGINTIDVRSLNRFDKAAEEQITVRANIEPSQEQEGKENGLDKEEDLEELSLEIYVDPGPVWISVEADGNMVFSGTMLSGATQSFKAKEKFTVSAGKANATFFKFNGMEAKKISEEPGAARAVVFDRNTNF